MSEYMKLEHLEERLALDADMALSKEVRPLHVVTGAFSFSGRYIARRLLGRGIRVRTLTNHAAQRPADLGGVEAAPLDFTNFDRLVRGLEGAEVLYNTYWVRFTHGAVSHAAAVENTKLLIRAAERAGVRRMVHVSITN